MVQHFCSEFLPFRETGLAEVGSALRVFALDPLFLFPQGCVGRVVGWVQAQSGLITGVGVGVGVLEVAGLVAAASLCRAIRSSTD